LRDDLQFEWKCGFQTRDLGFGWDWRGIVNDDGVHVRYTCLAPHRS